MTLLQFATVPKRHRYATFGTQKTRTNWFNDIQGEAKSATWYSNDTSWYLKDTITRSVIPRRHQSGTRMTLLQFTSVPKRHHYATFGTQKTQSDDHAPQSLGIPRFPMRMSICDGRLVPKRHVVIQNIWKRRASTLKAAEFLEFQGKQT